MDLWVWDANKLNEKVRRKQAKLWTKILRILLDGNAPIHSALFVTYFNIKKPHTIFQAPSYSIKMVKIFLIPENKMIALWNQWSMTECMKSSEDHHLHVLFDWTNFAENASIWNQKSTAPQKQSFYNSKYISDQSIISFIRQSTFSSES